MSLWPNLFIFSVLVVLVVAGPNDYFSEKDAKHIETLIVSKQDKGSFGSLKDTFFAVEALKNLDKEVPNKKLVCKFATDNAVTDSLENVFYSVSVSEALGCDGQVSKKVVDTISTGLSSSKLSDLVYSVGAVAALKTKANIDSTEILPAVSSILDLIDTETGAWKEEENQEEGSPYLTGLALTALSQLVHLDQASESISKAIEGIANILDNADDDQDDLLIFRHTDNSVSSLKATAFLIKGIENLVSASKETAEVTGEQVEQIAAFLISQKFVSSIEEAHALLSGLKAVNSPAFTRPLVLTVLNSQIQATKEKGKDHDVKVELSDIWGKPIPGKNKVFLIKGYLSGKAKTPILSNQELSLVTDKKNIYAIDFLARPDPGAYVLEFRVLAENTKEYQTISSAQRRVQVVAQVNLVDGEVTVSESSDRQYNVKTHSFSDGKPVSQKLELSARQHLFVTFKLKSAASGRVVSVHQTFAQFTNLSTKKSTYLVIPKSTQNYEVHLDVSKHAKKFNFESGSYQVSLLVGDSYIDKSFKWNIAKVDIKFDGNATTKQQVDHYKALPEIIHQFREPAALAPEYITNIFSILVLVPLGLLVIGVLRAGGNISNYPTSGLVPIYALAFLGSLGSVFALIVLYWLRLKLFTALTYMGVLGIPTVVFGNFVLRHYADQRHKQKLN